jgi:hypothetical protein
VIGGIMPIAENKDRRIKEQAGPLIKIRQQVMDAVDQACEISRNLSSWGLMRLDNRGIALFEIDLSQITGDVDSIFKGINPGEKIPVILFGPPHVMDKLEKQFHPEIFEYDNGQQNILTLVSRFKEHTIGNIRKTDGKLFISPESRIVPQTDIPLIPKDADPVLLLQLNNDVDFDHQMRIVKLPIGYRGVFNPDNGMLMSQDDLIEKAGHQVSRIVDLGSEAEIGSYSRMLDWIFVRLQELPLRYFAENYSPVRGAKIEDTKITVSVKSSSEDNHKQGKGKVTFRIGPIAIPRRTDYKPEKGEVFKMSGKLVKPAPNSENGYLTVTIEQNGNEETCCGSMERFTNGGWQTDPTVNVESFANKSFVFNLVRALKSDIEIKPEQPADGVIYQAHKKIEPHKKKTPTKKPHRRW